MTRPADKTASDLDWPRLLRALRERCRTTMAAEAASALELLDDPAEVAERLAEVREARGLAESGEPLPFDGFVDVTLHLDRARREAVLEPAELLEVAGTVAASRRLATHLEAHRDRVPRLHRIGATRSAAEAAALRDLEEVLLSCFEEDGTLSDHASPALAQLRARVRGLREKLSRVIQELIETYEDVLQDRYFTIRDDRYVLPVRTDAHRRVHGIVHGHSGSAQTIYVEPREITAAGNELVIAQTEVAREEQRVLAELSGEVRARADLVAWALASAQVLDLRSAAARLAEALSAEEPEIVEGEIALVAARHPLLALDRTAVVENDIELRSGRVLVVSGPNGGGKTVVLKTVGLALLMLRAGLPVPAGRESRLPVARAIWTDMGDDQSLEQSLSTFAAHMKNIAAIVQKAGPGDVALLDELAGGTDPTEGAALAAEISRAVAARGVAVMCTTHYGSLKLLALQEEGFEGASLGFDRETLAPTFRLASGAPGVSGALAAARRYGLPEAIVEAARSRIGEEGQRVTALVEELEAERVRAKAQADAAVEERAGLDRARRSLEAERAELKRKAKEGLDREARELLEALRTARGEVRRIEERLKARRTATPEAARAASKALSAVASELGPGGKLGAALRPEPPPGRPATEEDLAAGRRVHVLSMGGEAEVVEPPRKGKVKVRIGGMGLTVPVDDLRVLEGGGGKGRAASPPKPKPIVLDAAGDDEVPAMTPDNTLDLRGERVDDALNEADKFIDRALQRSFRNAFFIHGHGTGALRDGLRRFLDEHRAVTRWKPAERRQGGEGVTVIWLED